MQGIVFTMKTLVDCQISEVEASDKLLALPSKLLQKFHQNVNSKC